MKKWLVIVLCILVSFAAGFGIGSTRKKNSVEAQQTEPDCHYEFINPLRCDVALISPRLGLAKLRQSLKDYISKEQADGKISTAAIYFRDLHDGPIVSINENAKFTPASLLKVPVMITYLKLAEEDPSLLQRKIGKDFVPLDEEPNTTGLETIEPKTEYTIDDLLYRMIVYSDNRSKDLLLSYLPQLDYDYDPFYKTLSDLGIILPEASSDDFISVKSYAAILRNLYNASYLDNDMSEKALKILSQSKFADGLVAGLPPGTKIAHKFGDRFTDTGEEQRHECGIIYYSETPYILCVMTRGKDVTELNNFLQQVSKTVFEQVEKK